MTGSIMCKVRIIHRYIIQYPHWSKLTKLPLALKLWGGKLVGQALASRYLSWEKDVLVQRLADWETQLIEEKLPTNTAGTKVGPASVSTAIEESVLC